MFQDKNKSILDVQDIFGILVAGIILGSAIFVSIWLTNDWQLGQIFALFSKLNAAHVLVGTILFLIYSYIIGHVVAMISSIIMEKWVIGKIFGYPSDNLLFDMNDQGRVKDPVRNWFRIFTVSLVLSFIFESFDHYCVSYSPTTASYCTSSELSFFSWIGQTLILHADFIAAVFKWIVWILIGGVIIYRMISGLHKRINLFRKQRQEEFEKLNKGVKSSRFDFEKATLKRRLLKNKIRRPYYWVLEWVAMPIRVLEQTIREIFGLDTRLNDKFLEDFRSRFKGLFNLDNEKELKSEHYWLTRYYIENISGACRDDTHKDASQNSMTRNVSIALLLSALALVYAGKNTPFDFIILKVSSTFLLLSFLLSIWSYYQYYSRSKAVFRRFVALVVIQENQPEK